MTQHSIWTTSELSRSILQQVEGITMLSIDDRTIRIHVGYNRDARRVATLIGSGCPRREVLRKSGTEVFHVDIDGIDVMVFGQPVAVPA